MADYGPQQDAVDALLEECYALTIPRAKIVSNVRRYMTSSTNSMAAWHAAEDAGRVKQVARARAHAVDATEIALIQWKDLAKRWTMGAAGDVAIGVATADLVGTGRYRMEDYIDLVMPWQLGMLDEPKEEAA